ncbi:alpha/beta fold hydrolase [soil metagenome]
MRLDEPRPHVVIIGGYLTEPLFYGPMRKRLLARGALRVTIAGLHEPDWLAAAFAGFGPALLRGARAIREARHEAPDPLIVVGHSAGGIVARLAMSPAPLDGRHVGVADDVGCLATLGTPHSLRPHRPWWEHAGQRATRFLERTTPGAWFAPATGYVTVGSVAVPPRGQDPAPPPKQLLNRLLTSFVGPTSSVGGDGIVTDDLARLPGARHVTLHDSLHGTFGGPWYGDGHVMDSWWPVVVEEWRAALEARVRLRAAPVTPSELVAPPELASPPDPGTPASHQVSAG